MMNLHSKRIGAIDRMYAITMKLRIFIVILFHVTSNVSSMCFGGINNSPYLDWVNVNAASYTTSACYNATSSDTTQGFAIHWKVDDENLYLAIAARAVGWVGFGLAETGGMKGADMVIFETAYPTKIRDAHVLDVRFPIDDVCQDWVLRDSTIDDGFIIFEVYRKLNTTDTQDRAIIDDSNPVIPAQIVIAAWGDSPTATYHGPNNVAQGSVRWYGTGDELTFVQEKLTTTSDGYFDLTVNYTIQPLETEYVDFCFTWDPDMLDQDVPNSTITAIAAEVIPSEESRSFVHHADVFGSTDAANASKTCLPSYGFAIFSWAPGVQPFVLPDEVGYSFGPLGGTLQSFRITMHYDNPRLVRNITDATTVRVYYSLTPRQHELGIMGMGDVLKKLEGVEIPAGLSQYDFDCPSDCSTLALSEPITVFQEAYHMHKNGLSAVTYHIRDDKIIRQSNVDFFDFEQAGLPKIRQQPFTINPGDSFVSKFWFDSQNGTTFGKSSSQEMNEAFLLYYPAKKILDYAPWGCTYNAPLGVCNSSMSIRSLTSTGKLERVFGAVPSQCGTKASLPDNIVLTPTSAGQTVSALIPFTFLSLLSTIVSIFIC